MEDIKEKKLKLRREAESGISALRESDLDAKRSRIGKQLFEFANFREAETIFFYAGRGGQAAGESIISTCLNTGKEVVVPLFDPKRPENTRLLKINSVDTDLCTGAEGIGEPDPEKCKPMPFEKIDIAVIPGMAFDEKGGRLGSGTGRYDRLMPMLPDTARKVALAFEEQIFPLIPMEPHDKYVDIIITEKRIIYKI
ncbi:MAG: 5-formyltetrahydrofolate cyclo-ligase [Desulfobacteraceae bacterium]|nr:5-formyltetrahydrofolate cyclo-ligase [Desulfobacteraceae bacterium]MCF8096162.1 5-formyltetrahydrofolate cyclo-ligase [Desulfobacteraceae bacterium]